MLFQNKCLLRIAIVLMTAGLISCGQEDHTSPAGYSLNNPKRSDLGKALEEISGIFFVKEDSSLLAISDSKERVFQINLKTQKLQDYTDKVIPKDADLEDIVKVDSSVFLLMSRGELIELAPGEEDSSNIKRYSLGLSGSNDFETLYYDPTVQGLILLCKSCAQEKGTGVRTAFKFDLRSRTFDKEPFYTISTEKVEDLLKNTDIKFAPSAAAIHPVSKRLFILSSAGQLLVVTDTRGQVIEAYTLNPDLYPQAEGIAFAPNGDMYISNEGKYGNATLFYFPLQQTSKKK
ncbi:MAG TPA: SdiA-regulated domain-containing protein [Flavisolibacter sp.]|nr:SdiA-regulated domain-containing protein [Flavisolibacter sp.]